jgi:hypothetical protein
VVTGYAVYGWKVDAAALMALAKVEHPGDVAAVGAALTALYRPWMEDAANTLQRTVTAAEHAQAYGTDALPASEPGTCLLFTDALRFDTGQRLASMLRADALECRVDTHLAALPTVTPTAKPAVTPLAEHLAGGPGLSPVVAGTATRVTADILRRQVQHLSVR